MGRLGFAIFILVVRAEIKGVRLALAHDMRSNEIMTPDRLAFFMRILEAKQQVSSTIRNTILRSSPSLSCLFRILPMIACIRLRCI